MHEMFPTFVPLICPLPVCIGHSDRHQNTYHIVKPPVRRSIKAIFSSWGVMGSEILLVCFWDGLFTFVGFGMGVCFRMAVFYAGFFGTEALTLEIFPRLNILNIPYHTRISLLYPTVLALVFRFMSQGNM